MKVRTDFRAGPFRVTGRARLAGLLLLAAVLLLCCPWAEIIGAV
jgi:hypothetical protein